MKFMERWVVVVRSMPALTQIADAPDTLALTHRGPPHRNSLGSVHSGQIPHWRRQPYALGLGLGFGLGLLCIFYCFQCSLYVVDARLTRAVTIP